MKFDAADFATLRVALFIVALLAALGAAGVLRTHEAARNAGRELASAQSARQEAYQKLERVRGEEAEIREKSARFNALQARGVIGEEPRLEWIELLKDLRENLRLPGLQYEISPQRSLDTAGEAAYAFHASLMKIRLQLLHEGDLLRFLDALRERARALIVVKSCSLSRLPRGASEGVIAQLQAECLIDWVTVAPPEKR